MNEIIYQIVSIRKKKGRRDQFRIEFSPEREPVVVSGGVLARARIAVRDRITESDIDALLQQEERQRCVDRAWSLLGRRKRGKRELIRTLKQRGFPSEVVEEVVERFEQMGYIDDREFARFWVLDRMERGRHGPERVRRELAAKGVAREVIDEALAPLRDPAGQRERARVLLEKWSRTARQTDPRKRRAAAVAYLMRRGFKGDVAWETVRAVLGEQNGQSPGK